MRAFFLYIHPFFLHPIQQPIKPHTKSTPMVDTIVLLLSPSLYEIHEPDKFTPMGTPYRFKQNPTQAELRNGIYKPRLTLEKRMGVNGCVENTLKIELSVPKLLFGNNFNELRYKDIPPVIKKLQDVLHAMGVSVSKTALADAPVLAIHYSKNMLFTDGSTPYHYINKIKESWVPAALDVNQTDYRNSGHSYKLHCNAYELAFYDKIHDLEKAQRSSKRAIEKDNELQLNLLGTIRRKRKYEVLRMELRLNKRQKIKALFAQLGIKAPLTFSKLCKPAIAKKVLLHYMDTLAQKRTPLLNYTSTNSKALLSELIINNSDLPPKQIFQLYGLKHALDIMTPRELRVLFKHHNMRSWNRLISEAGRIKAPRVQNVFDVLRVHLEKFKALRIY